MGLIWQVIYYQQKAIPVDEDIASERTFLIKPFPRRQDDFRRKLFNWISACSILLVTVVSCYTYYNVHQKHDTNYVSWLPQIMGWSSAVLYIGSRVPQLLKNYYNQSTEGLSIGMFLCAVMGNIFYTTVRERFIIR
jgi:hypothetical protein